MVGLLNPPPSPASTTPPPPQAPCLKQVYICPRRPVCFGTIFKINCKQTGSKWPADAEHAAGMTYIMRDERLKENKREEVGQRDCLRLKLRYKIVYVLYILWGKNRWILFSAQFFNTLRALRVSLKRRPFPTNKKYS